MRTQLSQEEVANSITHAIGMLLSLIGLIGLEIISSRYHNRLYTISLTLYGLTLLTLYTVSTLHHATTKAHLKQRFMLLDHCCIYVLIAGTYTPFMLFTLHGSLGVVFLSTIWILCLMGIGYKVFIKRSSHIISLSFYLLMGWFIVLAVKPLSHVASKECLSLLIGGGIAYSLGTFFFSTKKLRFSHAIWHVFVLAGSTFHYLGIVFYTHPF